MLVTILPSITLLLLHSSLGINRPRKGTDAGDHPPITPMRSASESELGHDGWRLYEYITKHFIATVSYDCKYLQTTALFLIGALTASWQSSALGRGGEMLHQLTCSPLSPCRPAHSVTFFSPSSLPPPFLSGGESFTLVGKTPLEPGFTAVLSHQAITGEETIPHVRTASACLLRAGSRFFA